MARFTPLIPSWDGDVRRPRSTVASGHHMTGTAIMISRADGGRNEGNLPVAEIMRRLVAETEAALSRAEDLR
jgi:hypothetical protein